MKVMPSPQQPSAREVLIESLGSLSKNEQEQLHGPEWTTFATRKVRSLRKARKWVYALGVTMGLFAIAVPTTAFYHYYQTVESFSILGFLGLVAGACTFAAAQMGWAVYTYLNWRHQLQCYRGLQALGQASTPETAEPSAASAS
jgi:hypothetical protein